MVFPLKTEGRIEKVGWIVHITTVIIRSGRLKWYVHVMMKSKEDWVKKSIEFGVECRIPLGKPRSTWSESVVTYMAKLEIDREDVHDRNK